MLTILLLIMADISLLSRPISESYQFHARQIPKASRVDLTLRR